MKKKVIYTCISGEYDNLRDYFVTNPEWDYVCFSDTVERSVYNESWKILPLQYNGLDDVRNARWHKINPHKILAQYEYSVWIDANIDIVDDEFYTVIDNRIANSETFAVMKHPDRNCLYDEAKVIIDEKVDSQEVVNAQINEMEKMNYPRNNGLIVSSILFRLHGDSRIEGVMDEWWSWVRDFSKRDQLSLNYSLWKQRFTPTNLPFVYKNPGKSGPLFWRRHDYVWKKIAKSREDHIANIESLNLDLTEKVSTLQQENINLHTRIEKLENSRQKVYLRLLKKIKKIIT